MPTPLPGSVDALRVAHVQWPQRLVQALTGRWHHDEMYMIRHQAIGQHIDRMLARVILEPPQINRAVFAREKYRATAIATLRDMVRKAWTDDARNTRHERTLTARQSAVDI
jgi:hypothetical protein